MNALVPPLGPGVLGVPRNHGFDLLAWLLPIAGIALGGLPWAPPRGSGRGTATGTP